MSGYVVDPGVAVKWLITETFSDQALRLLDRELTLVAPELIFAEAANALWAMCRRGDITKADFAGGTPQLCGAVTPRGSVALSLEGSVVLVPSTAPRRGAPLRCAPFGVTSTARGALPRGRSGRRDGRRGRTKGWDQGQAASATAARCGLKGVWVLSMAQATARRRSATLRKARPWL